MAIKVLPVSGEQAGWIDAVVALGDRYTKRLGLLTPPAYRKAAEDGGLLLAMEGKRSSATRCSVFRSAVSTCVWRICAWPKSTAKRASLAC